jgi:hypothetical protein
MQCRQRKVTRRVGPRRSAGSSNEPLRCVVDSAGRQHFNFDQRVWLHPAVPMAYTKVPSAAMTTLAANLLVLAIRERSGRCQAGVESALAARYAVALAHRFSTECLLNAPDEGWVIPRAAIRAWLATRLSRSEHKS